MPPYTPGPPLVRQHVCSVRVDHLRELAAALESGLYEQTDGKLKRRRLGHKVGYCCHGVECELAGVTSRQNNNGVYDFYFDDVNAQIEERSNIMPPESWQIKRMGFVYDEIPELLMRYESTIWVNATYFTPIDQLELQSAFSLFRKRQETEGNAHGGKARTLAHFNDAGVSFKLIAKIIRVFCDLVQRPVVMGDGLYQAVAAEATA